MEEKNNRIGGFCMEEKKESKSLSIMEDKQIAQAFYDSGIFKDVKSAAQTLVKIIAGREQGLSPIESMTAVYILDDKICYLTKVFTAKIKKTKILDYRVKTSTEEICTIEFYENGELLGTSSYSIKQAAKAGLINKDNWRKYPQIMLYNRAVSMGIKLFMPQILGGVNLYEDFDELPGVKQSNAINVNMETGEITPAQEPVIVEQPKKAVVQEAEVVVEEPKKTEEEQVEELF